MRQPRRLGDGLEWNEIISSQRAMPPDDVVVDIDGLERLSYTGFDPVVEWIGGLEPVGFVGERLQEMRPEPASIADEECERTRPVERRQFGRVGPMVVIPAGIERSRHVEPPGMVYLRDGLEETSRRL